MSPTHRERFEPGAFNLEDERTRWLDIAHDRERVIAFTGGGGLELRDTEAALEVRAELPRIPAAERALDGVKSGRYSGFSVEFRALAERQENELRVVERADLAGLGLVEDPSYPGSRAELRGAWKQQIMQGGDLGRWARSTVPTGRTADCDCIEKPEVNRVHFRPESFDLVLDAVEAREHVIQAVIGNTGPHNALGTTATGALRLARVGDDLGVMLTRAAADTPAGRSLVRADATAPAVVRPLINHELSVWNDIDGIRFYDQAWLAVLLFKSAPTRAGWNGLEFWVEDSEDEPAGIRAALPREALPTTSPATGRLWWR